MTKLYYCQRPESEPANSFAGIPALQVVLDPCQLGKYLDPILAPQWGVLRDIQLKVLKHHHGNRCTVDISLETTTGKHELIGKVYAEDRSDVYRAMKQISQAGFGPEAEFPIPQPLAYLSELNFLLQEKVHGQSATEIFSNGNDSERARAAERCAHWLAHFHNQAPKQGPLFHFSNELGEYWVRRMAKRAGAKAGPLSERATLLVKRLERAAPALDRSELCACHGYSHHHVIVTEARAVTFDWDKHCVADPAWDVAKFIISLQKLALRKLESLRAFDAIGEAFYKTYTAVSRFEVNKHLPFYKAAHCLRRAKNDLRLDSDRIQATEAMLDEGLRVLAEEV
jgi:aminoglycoside phosphotransferase (APT) family kinase protein